MPSVLDPAELAASPLADLHLLANELGVDGFRRLRKAELIDAILVAQGGEPVDPAAAADAEADSGGADDADERPARRQRSRAGGRSRSRRAAEETEEATAAGDEADAVEPEDDDQRSRRRTRGTRAGRGRGRAGEDDRNGEVEELGGEDTVVAGIVDLMGNGSGFIRLSPPETTDDDVYVSAAQVKRCELVSGDTVAGPVRRPRRSERYPSLIRVTTINGRPADQVAEGTRFEELPATFPSQRFELGSEDATLRAIEWLTPFGRGSRVTVTGPSRAGKTETLLRLASALSGIDGVDVSVALAGARPEEVGLWTEIGVEPAATARLGTSADAQAQAVEQVIEQAKRLAGRGEHALVIVDGLEGVSAAAARRALAAARNIPDGGSLTIVAATPAPVGGETTVIALDPILAAARRFPALDLALSGTLRPELLVGEAGAEAIAKAREAL